MMPRPSDCVLSSNRQASRPNLAQIRTERARPLQERSMIDLLRAGASAAEWQQAAFLWLLRATILCVVAAIASAFIQGRSAEMAYRVWIGALAGVLLLPLFGAILPGWTVKLNWLRSAESE